MPARCHEGHRGECAGPQGRRSSRPRGRSGQRVESVCLALTHPVHALCVLIQATALLPQRPHGRSSSTDFQPGRGRVRLHTNLHRDGPAGHPHWQLHTSIEASRVFVSAGQHTTFGPDARCRAAARRRSARRAIRKPPSRIQLCRNLQWLFGAFRHAGPSLRLGHFNKC
jgi:hypothetical protein